VRSSTSGKVGFPRKLSSAAKNDYTTKIHSVRPF